MFRLLLLRASITLLQSLSMMQQNIGSILLFGLVFQVKRFSGLVVQAGLIMVNGEKFQAWLIGFVFQGFQAGFVLMLDVMTVETLILKQCVLNNVAHIIIVSVLRILAFVDMMTSRIVMP